MTRLERCTFLEYTDIPKLLFTAHHEDRCFTDVIRGHCVLGHSCTNAIPVMQVQNPRRNRDPRSFTLITPVKKRDRQMSP
jgi:hypothetical protein